MNAHSHHSTTHYPYPTLLNRGSFGQIQIHGQEGNPFLQAVVYLGGSLCQGAAADQEANLEVEAFLGANHLEVFCLGDNPCLEVFDQEENLFQEEVFCLEENPFCQEGNLQVVFCHGENPFQGVVGLGETPCQVVFCLAGNPYLGIFESLFQVVAICQEENLYLEEDVYQGENPQVASQVVFLVANLFDLVDVYLGGTLYQVVACLVVVLPCHMAFYLEENPFYLGVDLFSLEANHFYLVAGLFFLGVNLFSQEAIHFYLKAGPFFLGVYPCFHFRDACPFFLVAYPFFLGEYPFSLVEYLSFLGEYPFSLGEYPFSLRGCLFSLEEYLFSLEEYPFSLGEYPFSLVEYPSFLVAYPLECPFFLEEYPFSLVAYPSSLVAYLFYLGECPFSLEGCFFSLGEYLFSLRTHLYLEEHHCYS